MASFGIRFFISNIYLTVFIGMIILIKRILKNFISERTQYNLWFLLFGILVVPFVPIEFHGWAELFTILAILGSYITHGPAVSETNTPQITPGTNPASALEQVNDFAISVSSQAPSFLNNLIITIWIIGMVAMALLLIRSWKQLHDIENSALPLQNEAVQQIYKKCCQELGITKTIPIYSTAFLKSPATVGFLKPRIYLPIHLISDYNESDVRFMLLHELQHYRHRDGLVNHLMNLAGIVYWFHPLVWYALKEMRTNRELACDASVLQMLTESEYKDYGNTLINFAEKVAFTPFPFASGISSNAKQMRQRILNIVNFQKETPFRKIQNTIAYFLITVVVLGCAPVLSTHATYNEQYNFEKEKENIAYVDLSSHFSGYDGTFVLLDCSKNTWNIYNEEKASLRVSPDSTYKIYDALFALEENIIMPASSIKIWDGQIYPFEEWNTDQTLQSAMYSSVNWYFQALDEQLRIDTLKQYIHDVGYGNEDLTGDLSSYWMESSLKISPIEQVELLKKLHDNEFGFGSENIDTVKESILLSSSASGSFYGKTGTGRIDGQDINGWFIGFIETSDNTYYFATNISASSDAAGSRAMDITLSILAELNIWS